MDTQCILLSIQNRQVFTKSAEKKTESHFFELLRRTEHLEPLHPHLRVAFLPLGPITLKSLRLRPYKEASETLGEHLQKRRIELALLQKDVASRLQVNAWTYLGWEHDRKRPPIRFWPRIIEFLGYDPSPEPQTVGERIWAKRRKLGLSQADAARLIGVDEGTLRRYERGKDRPTPAILSAFETFILHK